MALVHCELESEPSNDFTGERYGTIYSVGDGEKRGETRVERKEKGKEG